MLKTVLRGLCLRGAMETAAVMIVAMPAVVNADVGQAEPTIKKHTVSVYVENGLAPMSVVQQSQMMAARMFAGIGVTIDWYRGVPKRCSTAQEWILAVRTASGTPQDYHAGSLALSQPYEGVHVTVFYDRVISRYEHGGSILWVWTMTSRLLAHVLVHEISHMLQGVRRHSKSGVMKALWTTEDFREMEQHMLAFAPEDVRLIHGGLSRAQRRNAGRNFRCQNLASRHICTWDKVVGRRDLPTPRIDRN